MLNPKRIAAPILLESVTIVFLYLAGCITSVMAADEEVDPILVGEIEHLETGLDLSEPVFVHVSGNYAYVVSEESDSFSIIDITDPFAPLYIGGVKNGDNGLAFDRPTSVFVKDEFAYITANYSNVFYIFNIADPSAPQLVGSIADGDVSGTINMKGPFFVQVAGDHAYVLNYVSDNILIFDISDPTMPTKVGEIHDGEFGGQTMLNGPVSAIIVDDKLMVASQDDNALEIIDITDPSAPRHLGSLADSSRLRQIRALAYRDGYLFATSRSGRSFQVINVTDPQNPRFSAAIADGQNGAQLTDSRSIALTDKYALITSFRSNALEVINIVDPTAPYHVLAIQTGDNGVPFGQPTAAVYDNKLLYATLGQASGKLVIVAPTPTPDISSVPSNHDYGDVNVGDSVSQEFVVSNSGYADLIIGPVTLLSGGEFTVGTDTCSGQTLAPRDICLIAATAAPQSGGEKHAEIEIQNNTVEKNPFIITLDASAIEVTEATYDALVEAIEELDIRDVTKRFLVMRSRLSEKHYLEGRLTPSNAIIVTIRVNIEGLASLGLITDQEATEIIDIIDRIIAELLTE